MIDVLMMYCVSVAALISVAALVIERAAAMLGCPRRAVWIAALIASLCLPVLMIAKGDSEAAPTVAVVDVPTIVNSDPSTEVVVSSGPSISTVLKGVWLTASGGLFLLAVIGWIRLRYVARLWSTEIVNGTRVRIADDLGPAVVGFVRPEIVVPRWLLAAPESDRYTAIAHEQSHIAAGDPVLLLVALCFVVITPWSLPMWWQLRRLRFAIEVDCDQRVLRGGASLASYGEMLLAVGQRKSRTPIGAIALTEPTSQLEKRIRIMTSGTIRHVKLLIIVLATMSVSLVAVAAQLEAPSLSAIAPNLFMTSVVRQESPAAEFPQTIILPLQDAVKTEDAVPSVQKVTTQAQNKKRVTKLAAANPGIASTQSATERPAATEKLQVSLANTQESVANSKPPKRIHYIMPVYPESALQAGIYAGSVDIAFTIAVTGDVQDAEVRKSLPEGVFDEAALTAVRLWRFEPAMKEGMAAPTRMMIRLKFSPPPNSYPTAAAQNSDTVDKAATVAPGSALVSSRSELLTMKFTDIEVRSVLKLLAETGGQNIVISDKVDGKITLQLSSTPWDQALDVILKDKGLVKREQGGVIFISPASTTPTPL